MAVSLSSVRESVHCAYPRTLFAGDEAGIFKYLREPLAGARRTRAVRRCELSFTRPAPARPLSAVVDCADGCQKEIEKETREKSHPQPVHVSKEVGEEKSRSEKAGEEEGRFPKSGLQKEIIAEEGS